jgi:hypothetical protein
VQKAFLFGYDSPGRADRTRPGLFFVSRRLLESYIMLDTALYPEDSLAPTGLACAVVPERANGAWQPAIDNHDRAVFDAIAQALRSTGHPALREIEIEIDAGVVVLWGRVPSYYQKQLAQEKAQQVHGAGRVANGIEVVCCRYREPMRAGGV